MGYAIHWAAMKDGDLETMCAVFGLRPTGKREEIPESDIVGAKLPSGWSTVIFNRKTIKEELLKQLSTTGEVVSCFGEEHVMFSSTSGWKYGGLLWSVTHDCEKGLSHIATEGPVPNAFAEIRRNLLARQTADGGDKADVDHLFDAPIQLAKELIGFRFDEEVPGISGDFFEILEPAKINRKSKGLFGRLFGKQARQ